MAEPHVVLNALPPEEAREALGRCCGSARWVTAMLSRRPWVSTEALHASADQVWGALDPEDFREAFAHHPRIGAKVSSAQASSTKVQAADGWARQEQARVADAALATQTALREANDRYFDRFGYIFIVCATGKSAEELLGLLQARLPNDPARELGIAAAEQARITHLRLDKLGT